MDRSEGQNFGGRTFARQNFCPKSEGSRTVSPPNPSVTDLLPESFA